MSWIGLIFLTVTTFTRMAEGLASYRLPETIRPIKYDLDIITDLESFTFEGTVKIKVDCIQSTSTIALHSVGLTIASNNVTVQSLGRDGRIQDTYKIAGQEQAAKNDFYIIKVEKELKGGRQFLIQIPFNGTLEPTLSGYYRSSYLDRASNSTRWLGVTQFEPSDARRAFPCFDEPEMKAKFTIRLAHKDGLSAVSNMPLVLTTPMDDKPGWSWDEFQESVPMSTYLVAWLVSDFGNGVAPLRPNNVTFKIWARQEALDYIGFASDVGPKVLEFFEELFNVRYPLPKQDMAAIPDFSSGAMENWGLITYRETELLYDPKRPSIHNQERVAYVVAHELAHQWFGNLVTMKWWTDLWLNEGFATYVGALGVHNVLPKLNYLNEASMDSMTSVYDLDSLKSSHPISVEVGPPSEVHEIFDAISYKKGSTVIRMMHNFLGDSFKTGVSKYLKAHKYGNAVQDDLWDALTKQAHEDGVLAPEITVKEVMDSWTLQTGYPLLTIERNYATGAAYVNQTRFLRIPEQDGENENKTCWWFPLTFTTESSPNFEDTSPKQWLKCGERRAQLKDLKVDENEWLVANIKLTGLARVMYDDKNWALIIGTLKSDRYKSIGSLNRAGLLLDVFDFAERGDISYKTALDLSSYLSRETEYIPLQKGYSALGFLNGMLSRTPNFGAYKRYMRKILLPLHEKYNNLAEIPKDTEQKKIHNMLSFKFCQYDVGDCSAQAIQLYEEWAKADLDKTNPIPFDLQPLVLCQAVKHGGERVWNKVWERYLASNLASEKAVILRALACTRETWLLNRYLDWSIDENSAIRKQDSVSVFTAVTHQDYGFFLGWNFFQRNIEKIYKYHSPRTGKVGPYLMAVTSGIMHQDELERVINLIETNKQYFEGAKLQVKQAGENAAANIKWHEENYEQVSAMLQDQ